MKMDVVVKIPQERIREANEELNKLHCLRKAVRFELMDDEWMVSYSCSRYGSGYGVGFSCKENCNLRITDLSKCREIKTDVGSYLVQDEFYNKI